MRPVGSIPVTGSKKRTHTPRLQLVANVIPRSAIESRGGPITFHGAYGPDSEISATFERGVVNVHGPKRTVSVSSDTSTYGCVGLAVTTRAAIPTAPA